jgi:polyisoprenoid-binding protein YceI
MRCIAIALALSLLVSNTGCSWIMVRPVRPPNMIELDSKTRFQCSESNGAPIADAALASLFWIGGIVLIVPSAVQAGAGCDGMFCGIWKVGLAGGVVLGVLAALYTASADSGFKNTNLCRQIVAKGSDVRNPNMLMGGKARASFTAKGPAGMRIVGTTSDLNVSDDSKTVFVTVSLKNLNTGIVLRDKHMREKYLEVDRFPDAVLSVERSSLKVPTFSKVAADSKGEIKIHGKTKMVYIKYKAKKDGQTYTVTGSLWINIKDYGIPIPTFLGVTVKPDVEISVSFDVKDSSP